ncbi:type VI secretion system tube protein TssD [Geomesophilobacter sediminis]|uniref:Type VI secretion system tube protein Hcp n=1 Tax=Geomesophilobacter sediminis TaxID=2798584 RepID=A0A8J7M273_9BACT|nr:type VI secretion system tube protein TssD [Geomesophilobacter sediminis]MBJ6727149.1 type VI secretion system tube protein Hcp [Geomesophilobacter sediminis]
MKRIILALTALVLFGAQTVWAGGHPIYLSIDGSKQGKFKADVATAAKERVSAAIGGKISADGYTHSIVSPRDPQSGLPTGQRMHKPLVIIKEVSACTPQLYQAMFTNENLKTVAIDFIGPDAKGVDTVVQTITLSNASIASVHQFVTAEGKVMEEITFVYGKLQIDNKEGKTSASDDWESPRV